MIQYVTMKTYSQTKAGEHLKALRRSRGWSLNKMASELDSRIGMDTEYKIMSLDSETGRQIVPKFEKGQRLTPNVAFAYADIFGVSLDYIFGWVDNWQTNYRDIKATTGLSDKSINYLETADDRWSVYTGNWHYVTKETINNYHDINSRDVLNY